MFFLNFFREPITNYSHTTLVVGVREYLSLTLFKEDTIVLEEGEVLFGILAQLVCQEAHTPVLQHRPYALDHVRVLQHLAAQIQGNVFTVHHTCGDIKCVLEQQAVIMLD